MANLGTLDLPDHIYNWFINFQDRFSGVLSQVAFVNAGVEHGLFVGPASFVVGASDLHPSFFYPIVKYADDSYLLVGSSHLDIVVDDLKHTTHWFKNNNLSLNTKKIESDDHGGCGEVGPLFPRLSVAAVE